MKKKWVPAQCPEDCIYRGAAGDCGKYTRTGSPVKRKKYKRACKWDNDKGFAMFLMGKTVPEIAAELGVSKDIIWYRRNKFWSRGEA